MVQLAVPVHRAVSVSLALCLAAGLSGCAANELAVQSDSTLSGLLLGDGASSQKAAQDVWVADFQTANPRATVEYNPIGSGSGREAFLAGASSFAGSDRPFRVSEIAEEDFLSCTPDSSIIELPAYISPIAIVFNLEGVTTLTLDPTTIARIFTGEIRRWNDPAISALNPEQTLPDFAITAVHRADDSGVTENFTDYLAQAAPDAWLYEPSGEWPVSGGEAANQTSGVVSAVTTGSGTIGYVDASRSTGLGVASVVVGDTLALPTAESAAAIVDASSVESGREPGDLAIQLDRATGAEGAYPIVLISYLIGCSEYRDPQQAVLVKSYFNFVLSDAAQEHAHEFAGSAPISPALYAKTTAAVALIH
jgi:phosphate transport system substrate-binding protein